MFHISTAQAYASHTIRNKTSLRGAKPHGAPPPRLQAHTGIVLAVALLNTRGYKVRFQNTCSGKGYNAGRRIVIQAKRWYNNSNSDPNRPSFILNKDITNNRPETPDSQIACAILRWRGEKPRNQRRSTEKSERSDKNPHLSRFPV